MDINAKSTVTQSLYSVSILFWIQETHWKWDEGVPVSVEAVFLFFFFSNWNWFHPGEEQHFQWYRWHCTGPQAFTSGSPFGQQGGTRGAWAYWAGAWRQAEKRASSFSWQCSNKWKLFSLCCVGQDVSSLWCGSNGSGSFCRQTQHSSLRPCKACTTTKLLSWLGWIPRWDVEAAALAQHHTGYLGVLIIPATLKISLNYSFTIVVSEYDNTAQVWAALLK